MIGVKEFNHVAEIVSDAQKTVRFYMDILDARVVREGYIPSSKTRSVYLQIGQGMIELLCSEDNENQTKGFGHIAFLTDQLDAVYERLKDQYEFFAQPKPAGSGVGRLAFLYGPNREKVEFLERDDSFRQPPVKMNDTIVQSFDHISINAQNLERAKAFYIGALGLKELKTLTVAASQLEMAYVGMDQDTLELSHAPSTTTAEPLITHIAFRVADVDLMHERLKKYGVPVMAGFPKQAGTGIGRLLNFKDPDGMTIEIVDRKDVREL